MLKMLSKITGNSSTIRFGVFYQFWFGFVVLIGLLQLISLFLPLGTATFIMLSLLALFFVVINFKSALNALTIFYKQLFTLKGLLALLAVCVILILISYSANKNILHTDTFIYHFNAVKWAKEYSVVPGLANLHGRLGFNSSFFLFAAFTEIGVYANQSAHVALSFVMVVCLVHWLFIICNPAQMMAKRIFCLMTFVFLVIHIISHIDITSLSTDYPMSVLTLVFCLVLLDKLDHKILLLLPLSAVVFTFKLSGMLTIGMALIILLGYIFVLKFGNKDKRSRKAEVRILTVSSALFCFIVAGFVTRNIIVSGWLIYPFPVGNMHLPWSVPKSTVLDMMDWIRSYPKIPGGGSPTTIKENTFFFWFIQWFPNFRQSAEFIILCGSLFVLAWAIFQVRSFTKFIYARLNILLLILFSFASILFWFMSAPDIRFGSIYFFILLAGSLVLLFEGSKYKDILKISIFVAFIYQAVNLLPAFVIDRDPSLFVFSYTKPIPLKREIASPPGENPALYVYMPVEGDACGNSPLPCTPYAGSFLGNHGRIRQRVPGDFSKGFLPTYP